MAVLVVAEGGAVVEAEVEAASNPGKQRRCRAVPQAVHVGVVPIRSRMLHLVAQMRVHLSDDRTMSLQGERLRLYLTLHACLACRKLPVQRSEQGSRAARQGDGADTSSVLCSQEERKPQPDLYVRILNVFPPEADFVQRQRCNIGERIINEGSYLQICSLDR